MASSSSNGPAGEAAAEVAPEEAVAESPALPVPAAGQKAEHEVSTSASSDDGHAAATQADSSSFTFSKDAKEFVPGGSPMQGFQFNASALEFQPRALAGVGRQPDAGTQAGTPLARNDAGSPSHGLQSPHAMSPHAGGVAPQPAFLQPVPVVAPPGVSIYPVIAVRSPNGPTPVRYTVAPGVAFGPAGPAGAVSAVGFMHAGPNLQSYHDNSGMAGQGEPRGKFNNKGSGHRQHHAGGQQKGGWSPGGRGQGQNQQDQQRQLPQLAHKESKNHGHNLTTQSVKYDAHALTKADPRLQKESEEQKDANKEDEKEEKEDKEKEEEDTGEPKKKSWADIARQSMSKQAASGAEATARALPKRVPTKAKTGGVPSVAVPKAVSWGPGSKEQADGAPAASPAATDTAEPATPVAEVDALALAASLAAPRPQVAKEAGPEAGSGQNQAREAEPEERKAERAEEEKETKEAVPEEAPAASVTAAPASSELPTSGSVQKAVAEWEAAAERAAAPVPKSAAEPRKDAEAASAREAPAVAETPNADAATPEKPKEKGPPSWADRLFKNPTVPSPKAKRGPQPKPVGIPANPTRAPWAKAPSPVTSPTAASVAAKAASAARPASEAKEDGWEAAESEKPAEAEAPSCATQAAADKGVADVAPTAAAEAEEVEEKEEEPARAAAPVEDEAEAQEDEEQEAEEEAAQVGKASAVVAAASAAAAGGAWKAPVLDSWEESREATAVATADDAAGKGAAGEAPKPAAGEEDEDREDAVQEASSSAEKAQGMDGGADAGAGSGVAVAAASAVKDVAEASAGVTAQDVEEEDDEDEEVEDAGRDEDDEELDEAHSAGGLSAEERAGKEENTGGGADSAAGGGSPMSEQMRGSKLASELGKSDTGDVIKYSVAFLKSMATAPASQGCCPTSVPTVLRNSEDGEDGDLKGTDERKRYKMEFLKQFKEKAECKELPANHRIPKDIRSNAAGGGSPRKADGGNRPALDEEDDWRADQTRYQAQRKEYREKDKGSRSGRDGRDRDRARKATRDIERRQQEQLVSSETSWLAQQQASKAEDNAKVVREMKSILNKLTIEKFDTLSQKLLECGMQTREHIETLMREVFEKATTQHHFISMYTDLCVKINEWLPEQGIKDAEGDVSFKRILLNQCQDSFDKYLKPPEDLDRLEPEEQFEEKLKYKTKMLGNMKFVGQLLINKVVSTKIIFQCTHDLLNPPSEETLETLCAFLHTIGPVYDSKDWKAYEQLTSVFVQVKEIALSKSKYTDIPPRIKFLLKDLCELRAVSWNASRPTNQPEGPMKMSQVKAQWAKDQAGGDKASGGSRGGEGEALRRQKSAPETMDDEWATVGNTRRGMISTGKYQPPTPTSGSRGGASVQQATQSAGPAREGNSFRALERDKKPKLTKDRKDVEWRRSDTAPELRPERTISGGELKARTPTARQEKISLTERAAEGLRPASALGSSCHAPADEERSARDFREEVQRTIAELGSSHDLEEAMVRVRAIRFGLRHQKAVLVDMISKIVEERNDARPCLWTFFTRLFKAEEARKEVMQRSVLAEGLEKFVAEIYSDLKCDVPKLPSIIREELLPALEKEDLLSRRERSQIQEALDRKDEEEDA